MDDLFHLNHTVREEYLGEGIVQWIVVGIVIGLIYRPLIAP